eukprot:TRINITY_DN440_c0_g1_i1.p1 TRINITY_DN440_c0_g1~~TRINITY_DN440_c0_g1_i1.p1  ORF type:complete len:388 (-),score=86.38 TRINITY_DN440_c0_g1_i1:85-1248(-)
MFVAAAVPAYEILGAYEDSRPLLIADVPSTLESADSVFRKAAASVSGKLLFLNAKIAVMDAEDDVKAALLESALPFAAELIPVARSKVSLPAAATENPIAQRLQTVQKSETVQRLIDAVSTDNLYNVLNELSTKFFTRQAQSTGAYEAQEWIARIYTALGYSVSIFPFRPDYAPNVIAELRGSIEPEKYVIIGAHFDCRMTNTYDTTSRAPGADDDGSGTTAVLEIARVLAESGLRFRYTIRIASWGGEEQGLLGSTAYVADLKAKGVNVVAYLNADMLGFKIPSKPITLGMKGPYTTTWLNDIVNSITATYFPTLPISTSNSCCSDYKPFYEAGYPASGFFENDEGASSYPCYHNVCDTIAEVNMEQVTLFAKAMIASTATFAEPQ